MTAHPEPTLAEHAAPRKAPDSERLVAPIREAGPLDHRRPLSRPPARSGGGYPGRVSIASDGPDAVFDTGPEPVPGGFDEREGDPHGRAHTSFLGWIRAPGTAPRDPPFFLLRCTDVLLHCTDLLDVVAPLAVTSGSTDREAAAGRWRPSPCRRGHRLG